MTGTYRAETRSAYREAAYHLAALADTNPTTPGSPADRWSAALAGLAALVADGAPLPASLVCGRFGAVVHVVRQDHLDAWGLLLDSPPMGAFRPESTYREVLTDWCGVPVRVWTRGTDVPATPPRHRWWRFGFGRAGRTGVKCG
ncbi:hypothetical protein [Phytomonospora endophytica]|uniref:Uncharacterized protein n=1 Tax=Phytomonospora endophytica TaxID=714109 RepID=A0A841FQC3_9ACTN|nr:hypothetical protein [Phytomonospora endophytica]MBB6038345.1 hypothetical protein [Phytomonospora endophytica]